MFGVCLDALWIRNPDAYGKEGRVYLFIKSKNLSIPLKVHENPQDLRTLNIEPIEVKIACSNLISRDSKASAEGLETSSLFEAILLPILKRCFNLFKVRDHLDYQQFVQPERPEVGLDSPRAQTKPSVSKLKFSST